MAEHSFRLLSILITTSILARVLGVEGYGIYQYILGLVTIFTSLSYICGAEVIVPKLTKADELIRKIIMGNGFVIRIAFSFLAFFLFILFVYFTESKQNFYLAIILGFPIILNESFSIVTAFLQSQTKIRYKTIIVMIGFFLRAILFFVFYKLGFKTVYPYALLIALEAVFVALGLYCVYFYIAKESFFSFDFGQSISLFKQGFPFFIGLVFMFVFLRMDLIMLRYLSDTVQLGLYASSINLYNSLIAVAPMITMSFAPIYIYSNNDKKIIKKNVLLITLVLFMFSFLLSVILFYMSPFLIYSIFGVEFSEAINVFKYLVWILPLYFINEGLNLYLIKMRLGKKLIYKWLIVLLVSILSYLYMIPKYGVYGAVSGLAISYLICCFYGFYILSRKNKVP